MKILIRIDLILIRIIEVSVAAPFGFDDTFPIACLASSRWAVSIERVFFEVIAG